MSITHSATSSRLSTPEPAPPLQPACFYPPTQELPSKGWKGYWDPEDDSAATRGIPIFEPTIDEFNDFEGYMEKVECWGMKSGIVKIVPPKEWRDALDPINPLLSKIRIRNAIEQHMDGSEGMYHQKNMEKRRTYSVREWADICMKTDLRAPTREELGRAANPNSSTRTRISRSGRTSKFDKDHVTMTDEGNSRLPTPAPEENQSSKLEENASIPSPTDQRSVKSKSEMPEDDDEDDPAVIDKIIHSLPTPPSTVIDSPSETPEKLDEKLDEKNDAKAAARAAKKARLEARLARDLEWLKSFDPTTHWLPPGLKAEDYDPEFCQLLEKNYWRSCGLQGRHPMYGADLEGSLFTDNTKHWNVAHLPSALERLLSTTKKKLPGVNTPYLYWGMWRATFAWHVEDMDLFSINYIHLGAPKHWYAIPQERSTNFENAMRGLFPSDTRCPQFLRHKTFLASPSRLARSSIKPNILVQHAGEFVVTFPRGYHAGFNMGFNCAESVNFALESWIDLGRRAKACRCVNDSVLIDVEELLEAKNNPPPPLSEDAPTETSATPSKSKPVKRKSDIPTIAPNKKPKLLSELVTLKIPAPEIIELPCCLCVGTSTEGLLPVHDPPAPNVATGTRPGKGGWMAHESCAKIVPETWVDEADGKMYIFGVDVIVRDRWNLKCNSCTKARCKAHGAPVQCTKGKCPKAFHTSCASSDSQVDFKIIEEVEKQVIIVDVDPLQPPEPAVPSDSSVTMEADYSEAREPPPVPVLPAPTPAATEPRVFKTIRKASYELLCPQHNPAMIQARKTEKLGAAKGQLDKLMTDSNPRIRIRNSSGTFEVSLISVDERRGTVVVLWDGNVHREFKWGSIVWGNEGKNEAQKLKAANEASNSATASTSKSKPKVQKKPGIQKQQTAASSSTPPTGMYYPPHPYYQSGSANPTYSGSYPAQPSFPGFSYPYSYYYPAYVPPGGKSGTASTSTGKSTTPAVPFQPYALSTSLNYAAYNKLSLPKSGAMNKTEAGAADISVTRTNTTTDAQALKASTPNEA